MSEHEEILAPVAAAASGLPVPAGSARTPVDWEQVRKTDDPILVLRAMLEIWDPLDDAHLSGWGWGEIDLIMAARRVVEKATQTTSLPNNSDVGPAGAGATQQEK